MTYSEAIDKFGAIPYVLSTDSNVHSSMNAFSKMKVSADPKSTSGAAKKFDIQENAVRRNSIDCS